jgi:hypothetical protein
MKLSRLWQPRNPLFWFFVLLNVLASACGWALRALPLSTAGLLLIGSVGLMNSLLSMWLAWRLVRDEPPPR